MLCHCACKHVRLSCVLNKLLTYLLITEAAIYDPIHLHSDLYSCFHALITCLHKVSVLSHYVAYLCTATDLVNTQLHAYKQANARSHALVIATEAEGKLDCMMYIDYFLVELVRETVVKFSVKEHAMKTVELLVFIV